MVTLAPPRCTAFLEQQENQSPVAKTLQMANGQVEAFRTASVPPANRPTGVCTRRSSAPRGGSASETQCRTRVEPRRLEPLRVRAMDGCALDTLIN